MIVNIENIAIQCIEMKRSCITKIGYGYVDRLYYTGSIWCVQFDHGTYFYYSRKLLKYIHT